MTVLHNNFPKTFFKKNKTMISLSEGCSIDYKKKRFAKFIRHESQRFTASNYAI
jgi:hypothetical protein